METTRAQSKHMLKNAIYLLEGPGTKEYVKEISLLSSKEVCTYFLQVLTLGMVPFKSKAGSFRYAFNKHVKHQCQGHRILRPTPNSLSCQLSD